MSSKNENKNIGINYQINEQNQLEYGFNVLNNSIVIMIPSKNPIIKNLFIINTNVNIDNKIKNKLVLTNNDVVRIYNSGSGNCFFKVISQFLITRKFILYIIEILYANIIQQKQF